MSGIDPATVKRLTFIRLIYQQGLEQSHRPEPLSMTSILAFHDAVELFLVLAGEQLDAQLPTQTTFMDYWARLGAKNDSNKNGLTNGVNLTGKVAMDRLNRLRNSFKHVGTLPGKAAIEQARVDVTNFLVSNTPLVFGPDVDFNGLDMAGLVTQTFARDKLRAAKESADQSNYQEATSLIAEAFVELLDDYAQRKMLDDRRSVFGFGERIQAGRAIQTLAIRLDHNVDPGIGDHYTRLTEAVAEMQRSMQVIALGLDYRQYARFVMITPEIDRDELGQLRRLDFPWLPFTRENYEFCRDFVITTSLRLAEIDFDLDHDALYAAWERATAPKYKTTAEYLDAYMAGDPAPEQ